MKREDAPKAILTFDTETTGTDTKNDRIITCYAMVVDIDGKKLSERNWVIDPGIEIPEGAAAVHGMSTDWVREHGAKDVANQIQQIAWYLETGIRLGYPIVGYNSSYDLAILDSECQRHRGYALWRDDPWGKAMFFDPIVYDRANDKYRKGSRKLVDVARHHGIEVDESKAHAADYDVALTDALAWKFLKKSSWNVAELQSQQVLWKKSWAEGLTRYFAETGKTEDNGEPIVVDGSFPWSKEA